MYTVINDSVSESETHIMTTLIFWQLQPQNVIELFHFHGDMGNSQ